MKTLILGGVRSGKSRLAEQLATESTLPVTYIATATVQDEEMRTRIAAHRARRPNHWCIIEEPFQLAAALDEHATLGRCVIVDCLTLWLTNLLTVSDPIIFENARSDLIRALPSAQGNIILVSNETNMGIIPLGELSRRFCDEAGRLHQELSQACDRVVLCVAGLPLTLKGNSL